MKSRFEQRGRSSRGERNFFEWSRNVWPFGKNFLSGPVVTPRTFAAVAIIIFFLLSFLYIWYQLHSFSASPPLTVLTPADEFETSKGIIEVKGRTSPLAEVFLNGKEVNTSRGGQFQQKIVLNWKAESLNLKIGVIFYTAIYHQYLNPNLYMDVDSLYRGRDLLVHKAENHTNYTLFSLWYRKRL